AQALMVAFMMIVLNEFGDSSPERPFTDENHAVETGFLDRPDEPLRERVEVGGTGRQADHLHAGSGESFAVRPREQWIAIVDQEALAHQEAITDIRQIAT